MATTEFAGERLFVHTNEGAPNYALYEVDPEQRPRASWRLVIAGARGSRAERRPCGRRVGCTRTRCRTRRRRCGCTASTATRQSEVAAADDWQRDRYRWRVAGELVTLGFTSFVAAATAYTVDP